MEMEQEFSAEWVARRLATSTTASPQVEPSPPWSPITPARNASGGSSPLSQLSTTPSPPPPEYMRPLSYYPLSPSLSLSSLSSVPSSLGSTPSPDTSMSILTPPSTQQHSDADDASQQPPRKRRRITKTKEEKLKGKEEKAKKEEETESEEEETTGYLDLSGATIDPDEQEHMDKLLKVLHKRRKIVVVAGAGISVSAGIPDFRSSTGLFKSLKREHNLKSSGKDLFDASVYKDGDSTTSFHAMIRNLSTATKTASATPFHHLLATLAQEGRLLRLYTQNVDGIDTSLPPLATQIPLPKKGPWPKTVQVHGSLEHMTCTKCRRISEFDPELFDGPSPPACSHCEDMDATRTQHAGKRSHGIGVLRPRMVLYNEHNPDDEAIGSVVKADMRTRPDALIVVGTTLKVPGVKRIVKEMTQIVRDRRDGVTVWVNNDPPPALKDYDWDLVVQGPCDAIARHAAMRKWDEPEPELHVVSDAELEKVKAEKGTPQVVIASPNKKNKAVERVAGIITPAASPKMKPVQAVATAAQILKGTKPKKQATLGSVKRKLEDAKDASKTAATTKKQPANANTNAKKTTAPKKATAKKTTAAEKKAAAAKNTKPITNTFKQGKPVAPIKIKSDPQQVPQKPSSITPPIQRDTFEMISTPSHEIAAPHLSPVSPSSIRNNTTPPYPPPSSYMQPLIPLGQKEPAYRGVKKGYGNLGLTLNANAVSPTRTESPEERRRTISPTTKPKGMELMID